MNLAAVADTHAALWFLFGDIRLSEAAKLFMDGAASNGQRIAVSPISLVETIYLTEKNRILTGAFRDLKTALADPIHLFKEAAFTSEVAEAMLQIPRDRVPDMPDRIIAATAIHLGVPVLSRDGRIRSSQVPTIW
jgi:PIN domain nuclease of toxin-antitoxin system